MKKIVILTSAEGHLSIAQAIKQQLDDEYGCRVIAYRIQEFDLYLPIYQLFPSLFKVPYKLSEYKSAQDFARSMIARKYEQKICDLLDHESPDVIVSTYFLYDEICARYAKDHKIKCINVIANPRTIHPLEACIESDANLVFDNKAVEVLEEYGIPRSQIFESGWFVRSQFVPTQETHSIRTKLHLPTSLLTLLFTAGSDGSSTILKILPLFFQVRTPLQVVFICGNNTSLFRSLRVFVKTFRYAMRDSHVRFTILRYVENIHEYMQASDLVIGKAGPNSIFESIACHRPFFALTHISGQEDGNLELIKEYGLGYVQENPLQAISLLKSIISKSSETQLDVRAIQEMAKHNASSRKKLNELISTLLQS